eukprot:CAMPEP_0118932688 /NCGR_PEP_ID=MMETSP1169-20130426/10567_1 /TAXON_ID=36882 /ORGANISM="Pyramimonas obovata, Strain CCMP722" /LENGTH=246 /DNA_ID=CAMNT_0006875383 /DNA_START=54 /DNA_END=794 /DNA_ORIENTATION=-
MSSFTVHIEFKDADELSTSIKSEIDKKQFEELLKTRAFKEVDALAAFKQAYTPRMKGSDQPVVKPRGRPPAAKPSTPLASGQANAQPEPEAKRKRGRPPKAKPAIEASASATPKRRGRPPKASGEVPPSTGAKRGRPPKTESAGDEGKAVEGATDKGGATVAPESTAKRGGRPSEVGTKRSPSPSRTVDETPAKRGRGRPPKPKSTSESAPVGEKRGRGRPPKAKPIEQPKEKTEEKTEEKEATAE